MLCVVYGIYTREQIFHNRHKTLYNLFSPDPAVSCVGDIVKCTHYVAFCCIFHLGSSHGCVHMGQMDFISSIFVRV